MAIEDKGLQRSATRFSEVTKRLQHDGEVLVDAVSGKTTTEETDLSKRRAALGEQLELLSARIGSADPNERQAAAVWYVRKRKELLALEHPTLHRYLDHLLEKHRPEQNDPNADYSAMSKLSDTEWMVIRELVGKRISNVELDWLDLFKQLELFTPAQTNEYRELQRVSNKELAGAGNFRSLTSVLSRNQLKASLGKNARMFVMGLGFAASLSFAAPPGTLILTSLFGGEGSHWMGAAMERKAVRTMREFGVDRLSEGREVRDEYLMILERSRGLLKNVAGLAPDAALATVAREADFVKEILTSRASIEGPLLPDPIEEAKLQKAGAEYLAQLKQASVGVGSSPRFGAPPDTVGTLSPAVEKLGAVLAQHTVSVGAAFTWGLDEVSQDHKLAGAVLLDRQLDRALEVENPSLARYFRFLVEQKMAGVEIGADHIETVKFLAGGTPSVAEFNALSRLEQLGVPLDKIWPDLKIELAPGQVISANQLREILNRNDGELMAKLGKWLPTGVNLGMGTLILTLMLSGVTVGLAPGLAALLLSIGSALGSSKMGQVADARRLAIGVDLLEGRGVQQEFNLIFERFRDPRVLTSAEDGELKAVIKKEAALAQQLVASVKASEARGNEYDEKIHEGTVAFANNLAELAASNLEGRALREQVFEAWGALITPDTGRRALGEAIIAAAVPEKAEGLYAFLNAKWAFVDALQKIKADTNPVEASVQLHPYAQDLHAAYDALKMPKVPPPDETGTERVLRTMGKFTLTARGIMDTSKKVVLEKDLHDLAGAISKNPFAPTDVEALRALVSAEQPEGEGHRAGDARKAKVGTDWNKYNTIGKKKAEQIAQHTLNLFWTDVYYRLGGSTELRFKPPKLSQVKAKEVRSEKGQRDFAVEAKFKAGFMSSDGKFDMVINANGTPQFKSRSITLGHRYIEDIAERVGRYYAKAVLRDDDCQVVVTPQPAEAGASRYGFEIDLRPSNGGESERFKVEVTADGFADWSTFKPR